jgi:TonB family protein
VYPAEAKAQGIQGAVVLRAVIGTDGAVQNLTVVSGNSLLVAAALDAVRQWTYKPYLLNGEAVAVRTTVTVNFAFEGLRPPTSGSSPDVVSADVMADNTIKKVDPIYPPIAKAAKIQGAVLLDIVIRSDGTVESIKVISGSSLLQGAAVDAVKQWVYRPYLVDGVPTRIETTVMVNFALTT